MYEQQQSEMLTPHESIVTQEAPGAEFSINFQDMSTLANPPYPELDFHLQHDITGSNYFTYHTDPSTQLGTSPADMLYQHHDFPYQQQMPNMNMNVNVNMNMTRDGYGSLPSESSGFVPEMMEGYNMNVGQFESVRGGGSREGGRRQRGAAAGKGIEKKEKQRRERLGEKYEMLKALIPNRTKDDRATIVSDAIDYINELCRTVNELKLLVEKKRLKCSCSAASFNKLDTESSEVIPAANALPPDHKDDAEGLPKGLRLRSSWLQRRSKEALVDVRIIEDEVNIKITKKKKAVGCLLPVSRAVDELHLQVLNLAGGIIGECHVYMFNTQIMEGSSVYASAVAKKLIEVVDMY